MLKSTELSSVMPEQSMYGGIRGEDPGLTAFKQANPKIDPEMAAIIYKQTKGGIPPPLYPAIQPPPAQVNPFNNFAGYAVKRQGQ